MDRWQMRFRFIVSILPLVSAVNLIAGCPASAEPQAPGAAKPPANQSTDDKTEKLAPVLDPGQFFGPAAMGYAAAKGCPHVCYKLFCYCGCDITDNHKNLLDCFTSLHGVDCHICQEESMLALRMTRNEEPLAAVQKTIDEMYSNKYPFKEETPALKRYKATRKWQPTGSVPSAGNGAQSGSSGEGACCPRK